MGTTPTVTVTIRIHAHLQAAITSLLSAHQALRDALVLAGGDVQIEATTLAVADCLTDVTVDAEVLHPTKLDAGHQFDSHVTLWATTHLKQQTVAETHPVVLVDLANAELGCGPLADSHVLSFEQHQADRKTALLAEAKSLGIRAAKTWKVETIAAKIAAAKATTTTPAPTKPEPAATARTILAPCAAQTTTPDAIQQAIAERAELMAKLATLSNHELRELVALAFPATKTA
jgi:hypothetical protein